MQEIFYRDDILLPIVAAMLVGESERGGHRAGRTRTALDDTLTRTIGRLRAGTALLLGATIYVALGLALPLTIHAQGALFIPLNVLGAVFGWVVTLSWLFPAMEAADRRHLLDWTTELRLLSAQEFEWLVGEVFRREGWGVEETGKEAAPDGNVDLRIRRDGQEMLVQCKRWQSWPVGVDEIRRFAGTLLRERLNGQAGVFVTLSTFTEAASAEADKAGITCVDGRELHRRIEGVRASEPCPKCAQPMLLDRSSRGWWLRCPGWSDGCDGKRDLGAEPGRALDLLLAD